MVSNHERTIMKTTQIINFRPSSYRNKQNPVVNIIHNNDHGESILSLWLNGEVSHNNITIEDSKAAMKEAITTWKEAIQCVSEEPMISIRGNVYISPKAMTKLNNFGIFPQEAFHSKGSYDTFEYPAVHKPAFHYAPGNVSRRGVFKTMIEHAIDVHTADAL